jgi:nucleotide-binding universal stress UspA family protein
MREGKFCAAHMAVIEGEPAIAVAEFACANRADLVVLGTSARRHGERLLLGSVAEEIFRELKCPVVVLGPKVDFRKKKKRKQARFVFATDLEPHSLAALPKLLNIINRFDSDVLVIRAIHPDIKSRSERARIRTATRARFEAVADSNLQKHIKTIHVEFASPVKAITNFAHRTKANAIVMGVRSGGELSRAATHIPWTLAHRVIAEAKCPVITIRG